MAYKIPGSAFLDSAFLAYLSADQVNVTGQGQYFDIGFDTTLYNIGGNYSAGTFSAPTNGIYHFDYTIACNSPTGTATKQFFSVFDGDPWSTRGIQEFNPNTGDFVFSSSLDLYLPAGGIMKVSFGVFNNSATDVTIYGNAPNQGAGTRALSTTFSGYKVANV